MRRKSEDMHGIIELKQTCPGIGGNVYNARNVTANTGLC